MKKPSSEISKILRRNPTASFPKTPEPYALPQPDKEIRIQQELSALSEHHRQGCVSYRNLCAALNEDLPLLPVSAFRDHRLISVPEETIVRELTSSGTTGQQPSRIFLDAAAAENQQLVLQKILQDLLGNKRVPMLIIDARSTISPDASYSARRAGIAGFALFSSSRTWALDEHMQPDIEAVCRFAEEHKDETVLIFGFTYMIRQYFTLPLLEAGVHPEFSRAVLIHGGGWKKMTELSVSPEQFKDELREAAGIQRVHNYYGMAEQLGSISMECECGRLHASRWADIRILRPEDFSECRTGEQGVIALQSVLPTSYPGHNLLTEDLGRILGADDCPCGRKGKYFAVDGRVPNAEIRGCSDTFASAHSTLAISPGVKEAIPEEPIQPVSLIFDPAVMDCLQTLSRELLHDPACRAFPEIVSFGFWLRKAHLEQLRERYPEQRTGIGHVLITAPANMPVLFAYNWAVALLAGCSCTVRISGHSHTAAELLCKITENLLLQPVFADIRQRTAIVRFPRSDEHIRRLSVTADTRIFWGGDETVRHLHAIPAKPGCRDILFPDRYAICILSARAVSSLPDNELRQLCDRFYRDTYEADQNACSSPRIVFWVNDLGGSPQASENRTARMQALRRKWWNSLNQIVRERYHPEPKTLLSKYSLLTDLCMEGYIHNVKFHEGNRLITAEAITPDTAAGRRQSAVSFLSAARFGLFGEKILPQLCDLPADLGDRLQTVTLCGFDPAETAAALQRSRKYEALRIVPVGEALTFDPVWDGKDLIRLLSIPAST